MMPPVARLIRCRVCGVSQWDIDNFCAECGAGGGRPRKQRTDYVQLIGTALILFFTIAGLVSYCDHVEQDPATYSE